MSNVIKVPRPPGTAYNPDRSLEKNALIAAQVQHFREAEMNLPEELRTGSDVDAIRTEGQASAYIREVTRAIHRGGGRTHKVETVR